MITVPGYVVSGKIWESNHSTIYRGSSEIDKKTVIIKLLSDEHPSVDQISRFEQEYELLKMLQGNGTVVALKLEKFANNIAIIEEDGGESLQELLSKRKLSLKEFLNIAFQIVETLETIHQCHIIHKDINPTNILYNASNQKIKIIDFGMATTLSREVAEIRNPELMQEGTLSYISPEQTGRMNRGMDYRTDYYSLGVTFYQMVTGILPFQLKDMAELIHAHIAKLPIPPNEIDPNLPAVVSDIILKLMAKRAEDRYQSIFGLKSDLQKCIDQLKMEGEISHFIIGAQDISSRFQIPEKLYGREKQLSILLNTFNEVATGKTKLLLVSGYSGIGKSFLIHELYKPLLEKRGYFLSGKFEQFKKNVSYVALIQALEELVKQVLTETEEKLNLFKEEIQKALYPNARLMTDMIPLLTAIIGEQPPIPELRAEEAENRFKLVLRSFINAVAQAEHPLVIFLDDCQWVDRSTLNLLEALLLDPDIHHLMIITAYRDNEVGEYHILNLSLEVLQKANFTFQQITLPPLEMTDVQQLLSDTLHLEINHIRQLADLCYEKTQGNPFFLNQFLQTLFKDGILEFNSNKGSWTWDINKIQQMSITNNVVDLMEKKIKQLHVDTQRILELAACLGSRFDLDTLATICEKTPKQTFLDMHEALENGFILAEHDVYQFLHDRVQQAAYLLIPEEERNQIHLKIGRLLQKNIPLDKHYESIFNIVNHLNFGMDLITDLDEKKKLAELNIVAGNKAKDSIVFDAAYHYFKTSISLLGKRGWQQYYDLTFEAYLKGIEAAYLIKKYKVMERLSRIALNHAETLLNKIKIHQIQLRNYFSQNKLQEGVKLGLSILNALSIKFPDHPNAIHFILKLIHTKWLLRRKTTDDLYQLPEMNDPYMKAAMDILRDVGNSVFFVNPVLLGLLILEAMILSVKYGNYKECLRFYSGYGLILASFHQYHQGYQMCELSLRLAEHYQASLEIDHTYMMKSLLLPMQAHIDQSLVLLNTTYQKSLDTGNMEIAFQSFIIYCLYSIFSGKKLTFLINEMNKASYIYKTNKTVLQHADVLRQLISNLVGETTKETTSLKGPDCDEKVLFSHLIESNDNLNLLGAYRHKLFICYIFNDYSQAYEFALKMNFLSKLDNIPFLQASTYFLSDLSSLACFNRVTKKEQKKILKSVNQHLKTFKFWTKEAPMNFLNKYYLIQAVLANVLKKFEQAEDYFDQAIELSKKHKFVHEEAIANELTSLFYLARGKELIAKVYMQEAHYCYVKWGALAKVKQLEENYPQFLKVRERQKNFSDTFDVGMSYSSSGSIKDKLDLSSIMKSTEAITREIELTELLKKMLHIVIENAGAQKGYFLLEKSGSWYIEAQVSIDNEGKDASILKSIPIRNVLPNNIIQYVIRSKSLVALNNALESEQFASDPYIQRMKPKSILCMPLLNQNVLSGILYLENNLATDTFTHERMYILNLLSGQIVSAIDNAKLYSHLKKLNRAQESFVPKEFLNLLGKNDITEIVLGDQVQKEMTVMFCDIRNFTKISEKLTPEETMAFINNFLSKMEPIITQHNGVIDKYIGDAIMALFPKSADDAVRGSIAMLKSLEFYNAEFTGATTGMTRIKMGIGLNTGLLVLGTVGTPYRMEGTVLSDAVNIASRTENLTKTYRTPLLITEETYKKLVDPRVYAMRKIDKSVLVKGKSKTISIYEVFSHESERVMSKKYEALQAFEEGVNLFWLQEYTKASAVFQKIVLNNPNDLQAVLYVKRCKSIIAK